MNAIPAKPETAALRPLTELERFLVSPLPIRVVDDEQFRICEDGDGPMATFAGAETPTGELFDIVAWFDGFPDDWWSLRGLTQILGEPERLLAERLGKPLKLFETPASWRRSYVPRRGLKAGRDLYAGKRLGACIIDWSCDPRFVFSGVNEIITETDMTPSSTTSGMPPTAVATIGLPSSAASIRASPSPS